MEKGVNAEKTPKEVLSQGECSALPVYHKRAFAHNYHAPFIYHIIIKKKESFESFGTVCGDARIPPGQPGCAFISESRLGKVIAKEIIRIQKVFPVLQIYQYKVMPDHVHILLRVKEWTDYHLDHYIASLCNNIADSFSGIIAAHVKADDIFQPGYCDKPLLLKRNLDSLFRYIRENPHRLAMRQQFPHFFRRLRRLRIGDEEFEAFGNLFLLRNPDKEAVRVSRRFSPEENKQKRDMWLSVAATGAILVSPFISSAEKSIRAEAESLGAKVILIVHETFPDRYKPSAHDFDLCAEGRLLIISLSLPPKTPLTRSTCLRMNALAEGIAGM